MRVRDAMTANVTACTLDSSLAGVASRMWLGACGAVPVLDDEGRVAGIITDRDVCFAVAATDRPASEIHARELVARSPALYTCAAEDEVLDAMQLMREKRVRRLPVVDVDGRLEGILSMTDAILHATRAAPELPYDDVMAALQSLCRPASRAPQEADFHA